jgi:hypothetical protein
MADAYQVTIMAITQGTALDSNGKPQAIIRVTYRVGQWGPFTDTYNAATFTDVEANAGTQKRVTQIRAINGTGA